MATITHIKHKPIGSNASPLILKFVELYQPAQQMNMTVMKLEDCNTSEMLCPMAPFFLESMVLLDTPQANFLPIWWLSVPMSKWGSFAKEATSDSTTCHFWTLNLTPSFSLALAPLLEVEEWTI